MQAPETRYAVRPDGVSIAYQTLGEGPLALVWCQGFASHLDLQWTDPGIARFFRGLASFCRLVLYDKAGTGLSDPTPHVPTIEERAEDIRAVMDASGIERGAIFGESEGGPAAMMFAASYPERTEALLLYGTFAKGTPDDADLAAMGSTRDAFRAAFARLEEATRHWGEGRTLELFAPSVTGALARRASGTFERAAVSPGMARALMEALRCIDVSPILTTISAPTLVLHRRGDFVPVGSGRLLADAIPGARFVELPGSDHAFWTQDSDAIVREVGEFLTGARAAPEPDRVLATVLFTDIVDSTRRAAALGDSAWREVLERHDALVQAQVEGAGGRVVKSLGDGALSVFSGPARAIRCAGDLVEEAGSLELQLRAGVHTGECEAMGDDLGGLAVHIGARVAAQAAPGEVLVSSTVKELVVGSGLNFADRGEHELKGVPGQWRLHAVVEDGRDAAEPIEEAAAGMTAGDRATVRLARRAPGALRTIGRIAQRSRH